MGCQAISADAVAQPTPNALLLRQVLAQIETHPDTWDQGTYRCGTTRCIAGWAAELSGGRWAYNSGDLLIAEDGEEHIERADGMLLVGAHVRAERVLGLTEDQAGDLFDAHNNLPEIRRQMAALIAQVRHVTIRLVPEDELVLGEAGPDGAPLEIIDHQPGQPPYCYGTERGIDRAEMTERAQGIANHLGVPYIDPIDPAVQARLDKAAA